jgi:hypothetical protein
MIATFSQALDLYERDVGSFPTPDEGLQALRENPGVARWAGPYLVSDLPPDPWGRAYVYRLTNEGKPEIISLGRDGKVGGRGDDQDISSLRPDETILPSAEEARWEIERVAAIFVAPVCGIGYLLLPWIFSRFRKAA